MLEILVIIGLLIIILVREFSAFLERKDMLDRLMSKDVVEYKSVVEEEPNQLEVEEDDGLISIEQAKDDLINE